MDPNSTLKSLLDFMLHEKGSDLYLKSSAPPYYRAAHELKKFPYPNDAAISIDQMNKIAQHLMKPHHQELLERERSVDLSFRIEGHGRLRANLFYQQGELSCVIRIAWTQIPSFEELKLPKILKKSALSDRGLVIISGAVSSGKSTTANCLIDIINQNVEKHIVTIEDPLEFIHQDKKSLMNQREIGQDTPNFVNALRYAVRQAPDVIFIGEMRDSETFLSALAAAEIGRLVITTVHARSAMHTFERLVSFFPPEARIRILTEISYNLNIISCQRLVPLKTGKGYAPAFEILANNNIVADLVRQQRFDKLQQVMQNGASEGMQTMNQSLIQLKEQGLISELEMFRASDKPQELSMNMRGIEFGGGGGKIIGD